MHRLADAGLNMQWKGEPKGDKLAGKTLVVTGTLESLSRNEAEALIVKKWRQGRRLRLQKDGLRCGRCCGGFQADEGTNTWDPRSDRGGISGNASG